MSRQSHECLGDRILIRIALECSIARDEAGETLQGFRQMVGMPCQRSVDPTRVGWQSTSLKARPLSGQQMIEHDIDDDAGMTSERRFEATPRRNDLWMRVGVRIDATVQSYARGNAIRKGGKIGAANKVAGKLPGQECVVFEREHRMGKKVHGWSDERVNRR